MLDAVAADPLVPGVDYTVDGQGRWVFTSRYLKARGYCCFNACRNCPWGQAGRTPAEAFADLQLKLDTLERNLQAAGVDVEILNFRMGILEVRPPRAACATDLPGLGRQIEECAKERLSIAGIAWT